MSEFFGSFANSLGDAASRISDQAVGLVGSLGDIASGALNGIVGDLTDVLIGSPRIIGFIVPNITIEESHEDRYAITEHPVEASASISDHAYPLPKTVVMQIAWSNASLSVYTARGAYNALLKLQATREPFSIVTGKRLYSNMLIESVAVLTDRQKENALFATIYCREVLIARTKTVTLAPAGQQAEPERTAAPIETGPRQPEPRESVLSRIGGIGSLLSGGL